MTREGDGDRGVALRILMTVVWLPIQITLSLIFATGGIFFLLIAGVLFGPFVGLYFLVRHLLRGSPEGDAGPVVPDGEPDGVS